MLRGLSAVDVHFTNRGKEQQAAVVTLWGEDRVLADRVAAYVNTLIAGAALSTARDYHVSPIAVPERKQLSIRSVLLARLLEHYGFTASTKLCVPEVIWRGSEACVKGYLRALFQCDGTINVSGRSQS